MADQRLQRNASYRRRIETGAAVALLTAIFGGIWAVAHLTGRLDTLERDQLADVRAEKIAAVREITDLKGTALADITTAQESAQSALAGSTNEAVAAVATEKESALLDISEKREAGSGALENARKEALSAVMLSHETAVREVLREKSNVISDISNRSAERLTALETSVSETGMELTELATRGVEKILSAEEKALREVSRRLEPLAEIEMRLNTLDDAIRRIPTETKAMLTRVRFECKWEDVGYHASLIHEPWCPANQVITQLKVDDYTAGGIMVLKARCCKLTFP